MNKESLKISSSELHKLSKTGFNTELQVQMLRESKDLKLWLSQTKQDIKGFIVEYLTESMVLPNPLEFGDFEDKERIKGKLYGDRPLLDCISLEERFGAVHSVFSQVEEFLLKKKPRSIAFMTSPPGWSGFNKDGKDIIYPDTQTFCFRINDQKEIEAFTFVTDMDFHQNKTLLKGFGLKEEDFIKSWDEQERLADLTSKVVTLDDRDYDFVDIANAIKKAKNSEFAKGHKTFYELFQTLDRGEALLNIDEDCEKVIKEFEDWILLSPPALSREYLELVRERLSKTILKLSKVVRGGKSAEEVRYMTAAEYEEEYESVSELGGCNGGGEYIQTGLGLRSVALSENEDCPKIKCRRPGCGWEATEAEAEKVKKGELKSCPKKNAEGKPCGWRPK